MGLLATKVLIIAPALPIQDNFSFREVHQILELDPKHWFYEGCKEPIEKGLLKGREEGLTEGVLGREPIPLRLR